MIILKLQHNDASFWICIPTNRIAYFVEVFHFIWHNGLMEEPETTLKNFIPQTRNFVPDQMCNELYTKLYTDIIKPVNDITIQKFIYEVLDKLVRDKEKIRNLMCAHVGSKSSYQFTKTELEDFCQRLFFDFADHALRLSKTDYDKEEQTEGDDTCYE